MHQSGSSSCLIGFLSCSKAWASAQAFFVSFRTWYISGIFAATKNDYDMRLITSNEQLDALLPNIQVTVTGETPIFDKLSPFLDAAEKWLI